MERSTALCFPILLAFLGHCLAGRLSRSYGSTKGCDQFCQRECIDVINRYRENHDAPTLHFSQSLADRAQKMADSGKFGYDMEARGKYGQLMEWDVKEEFPTFTSVIKHWHDKEGQYDFTKGAPKNGKTLHDFTQVVWRSARKIGCAKGRMLGSRYYVVWMDVDGIMSPKLGGGSENVKPPKRTDMYWYDITATYGVGKPLCQNATNSTTQNSTTQNSTSQEGTTQNGNLTRSHILSTGLSQKLARFADEDEGDVVSDLNEVNKEQQVLNNVNNIKQYVHDSLSKVFAEEDKEVESLRNQFAGSENPYTVGVAPSNAKFTNRLVQQGAAYQSQQRPGFRLPQGSSTTLHEGQNVGYNRQQGSRPSLTQSGTFYGQRLRPKQQYYASPQNFQNGLTPGLNEGSRLQSYQQNAEGGSLFEDGERQIESADNELVDRLTSTIQTLNRRPGVNEDNQVNNEKSQQGFAIERPAVSNSQAHGVNIVNKNKSKYAQSLSTTVPVGNTNPTPMIQHENWNATPPDSSDDQHKQRNLSKPEQEKQGKYKSPKTTQDIAALIMGRVSSNGTAVVPQEEATKSYSNMKSDEDHQDVDKEISKVVNLINTRLKALVKAKSTKDVTKPAIGAEISSSFQKEMKQIPELRQTSISVESKPKEDRNAGSHLKHKEGQKNISEDKAGHQASDKHPANGQHNDQPSQGSPPQNSKAPVAQQINNHVNGQHYVQTSPGSQPQNSDVSAGAQQVNNYVNGQHYVQTNPGSQPQNSDVSANEMSAHHDEGEYDGTPSPLLNHMDYNPNNEGNTGSLQDEPRLQESFNAHQNSFNVPLHLHPQEGGDWLDGMGHGASFGPGAMDHAMDPTGMNPGGLYGYRKYHNGEASVGGMSALHQENYDKKGDKKNASLQPVLDVNRPKTYQAALKPIQDQDHSDLQKSPQDGLPPLIGDQYSYNGLDFEGEDKKPPGYFNVEPDANVLYPFSEEYGNGNYFKDDDAQIVKGDQQVAAMNKGPEGEPGKTGSGTDGSSQQGEKTGGTSDQNAGSKEKATPEASPAKEAGKISGGQDQESANASSNSQQQTPENNGPIMGSKAESGKTPDSGPKGNSNEMSPAKNAANPNGGPGKGEEASKGTEGQPPKSGNDTGKSGNDTGKSGNDAGKSGNDTGKSGNGTGKSGNDAGKSGNDTGKSGHDTGKPGIDTGKSDSKMTGNGAGGEKAGMQETGGKGNATPADSGKENGATLPETIKTPSEKQNSQANNQPVPGGAKPSGQGNSSCGPGQQVGSPQCATQPPAQSSQASTSPVPGGPTPPGQGNNSCGPGQQVGSPQCATQPPAQISQASTSPVPGGPTPPGQGNNSCGSGQQAASPQCATQSPPQSSQANTQPVPGGPKQSGQGSNPCGPGQQATSPQCLSQSPPQSAQANTQPVPVGQGGIPCVLTQQGMPPQCGPIVIDGRPMRGPYSTSHVFNVKQPVVFQTETTIQVGGTGSAGGTNGQVIHGTTTEGGSQGGSQGGPQGVSQGGPQGGPQGGNSDGSAGKSPSENGAKPTMPEKGTGEHKTGTSGGSQASGQSAGKENGTQQAMPEKGTGKENPGTASGSQESGPSTGKENGTQQAMPEKGTGEEKPDTSGGSQASGPSTGKENGTQQTMPEKGTGEEKPGTSGGSQASGPSTGKENGTQQTMPQKETPGTEKESKGPGGSQTDGSSTGKENGSPQNVPQKEGEAEAKPAVTEKAGGAQNGSQKGPTNVSQETPPGKASTEEKPGTKNPSQAGGPQEGGASQKEGGSDSTAKAAGEKSQGSGDQKTESMAGKQVEQKGTQAGSESKQPSGTSNGDQKETPTEPKTTGGPSTGPTGNKDNPKDVKETGGLKSAGNETESSKTGSLAIQGSQGNNVASQEEGENSGSSKGAQDSGSKTEGNSKSDGNQTEKGPLKDETQLKVPRPIDNKKPPKDENVIEMPIGAEPKVVSNTESQQEEQKQKPYVSGEGAAQGCGDNEERCSLWASHGHCRNVVYEDFMKQHCKRTCGYCGLPNMAFESHIIKEFSDLFTEESCKDSLKYQFSCPQWKAQGYCEKRAKAMKKVCRKMCDYCGPSSGKAPITAQAQSGSKSTGTESAFSQAGNSETVAHTQKSTSKNQDQASADTADGGPPTSAQAHSEKDFAHAQTGGGKQPVSASAQGGLNTASSQIGTNGQPTMVYAQSGAKDEGKQNAHAQLGSSAGQPTTAQAQSGTSSGAQSWAHASTGSWPGGYVIAQTGLPLQHGFAVAQSSNMPKQSKYASAHTGNGKGNTTASAQTGPGSPGGTGGTGVPGVPGVPGGTGNPKAGELPKPEESIAIGPPKFNGFNLDESVMKDSPEYSEANNNQYNQFIVETGDSGEVPEYVEPNIRIPIGDTEKSYGRTSGGVGHISGGNIKPGKGDHVFPKHARIGQARKGNFEKSTADKINSDEVEAMKEFIQRLNPEDPLSVNGIVKDIMAGEGKGNRKAVSTRGCNSKCQEECLTAINKYRNNHEAKSVDLDQQLANQAQRWADKRVFGHSPWAKKGRGGEIIAVGSFYTTFTAAIKAWHDEERDFDWSKNNKKTGNEVAHFTQVIWKKARRLGCGKTTLNGEPYYIVQMDASSKSSPSRTETKRDSIGKPSKPDLRWFMDSSPYWKELTTRGRIPRNVHNWVL